VLGPAGREPGRHVRALPVCGGCRLVLGPAGREPGRHVRALPACGGADSCSARQDASPADMDGSRRPARGASRPASSCRDPAGQLRRRIGFFPEAFRPGVRVAARPLFGLFPARSSGRHSAPAASRLGGTSGLPPQSVSRAVPCQVLPRSSADRFPGRRSLGTGCAVRSLCRHLGRQKGAD
jgi:hypothetical protein